MEGVEQWHFISIIDTPSPLIEAASAARAVEPVVRRLQGGAPVPGNPSESQKNGKGRNGEFEAHCEANPQVGDERNEIAEVYILVAAIGLSQHAHNGGCVLYPNQLEVCVGHPVGSCIGGAGGDDGASLRKEP